MTGHFGLRAFAAMKRYGGLDVLRAAAMLLGVAYHAAYAYVPEVGPWYLVADRASHPFFSVWVGVLHSFRLEVFFLLGGFFGHLLLERRGPRGFLVDRARRLLIPLVLFLPLTRAADWGARMWSQSLGLMSPQYAPGAQPRFVPLHLWFLETLFVLCLLAWACARAGWRGAWLSARLSRWAAWPEVLLLCAIPTALLARGFPDSRPDLTFLPLAPVLAHHGLFFLVGWLLWPLREQLAALERRGAALAALGLALTTAVHWGPLQWQPLGQALASLSAWVLALGLFGLALGATGGERRWLRAAVEASLWIYLMHYPLVLIAQVLLAQTALPAGVKYAAVAGLALSLSTATWLAVRRSLLGPWFGARSAPTSGGAPAG